MTPQHKHMLKVGAKSKKFVPAFLVKLDRKYPNDYRKRLSEMKRLGWVEVVGKHERFAVWSVTKEGKQVIKG